MPTISELAAKSQDRRLDSIREAVPGVEVSFFADAFDTEPATAALGDVLAAIAGGDVRDVIEKLRRLLAKDDHKGYADAKRKLPGVTLSAVLTTRKSGEDVADRVKCHSGVLQADFDGKENPDMRPEDGREKLMEDPHVLAAFVSPSGQGVKALVRIPASIEGHAAAFDAAKAHYAEKFGFVMDKAARDITRLCFLSWDPDLRVKNWQDVLPLAGEKVPARSGNQSHPVPPAALETTAEDIREMLACIPPRPSYDAWLRIASAVWSELAFEEGHRVLSEWSPEEKSGEYSAKWKARLKDVKIGTLVHLAKEHGYDPKAAALKKRRAGGIVRVGGKRVGEPPAEDAAPAPPDEHQAESVPDGQAFVDSIIYDGRSYHVPDATGETLVPVNASSVKAYMRTRGIVDDPKEGLFATVAMEEIQRSRYALRVGAMAGLTKGWHKVPEGRIFVTRGPCPVSPSPVAFDTLRGLVESMLGEDQSGWFFRWLAIAHRSLVSGHYRPGQALALVGPPDSGKSLLLGLIVEAMGGRHAHPYRTWSEGSQFNGHLVGAECLVIDDESPARDMRARRNLGTAIKSSLFSDSVGIEAKYATPFSCRPWWRVIIACNSEPENVLVLPPMEESFSDKIALLLVAKAEFPPGLENDTRREAFRRKLSEELPGLLDHALALPVPPFKANPRTGIESFHHPKILDMLRELSKEAQLESLLAGCADDLGPEWIGTAPDLFQLLTGPDVFQSTREQARRLLDSPSVAGYLLRDLSKTRPGMVASVGESRGLTRWRVIPGAGEDMKT
jgi:hypothetical protein